jgi:predicted ATP-grasp superfamily ATP-dependent carboligase
LKRRIVCQDIKGHPLVEVLARLGRESSSRRPLFLTTDPQVRIVTDNREALEPYYILSLPSPPVVHALLNKTSFVKLARERGFDVPQFGLAKTPAALLKTAHEVGYPCIVKPDQNDPEFTARFEKTAALCKSANDVELIGRRYSFRAPLLVQEWIEGGDGDVYFVLHYFSRNSEPLVSFGGRKIRQSPPRAGHTASAQPADIPRAVQISESFFRSVGAIGLCSMEFKRPPLTDRLAMIEPTVGRTDWQEAVAELNGTPLPLIAYNDLIGAQQPKKGTNRSGMVTWVEFEDDFRSARYYRSCGELTLTGWVRSIWPFRPAVAALDDPLPGLLAAGSLLAHGARKCVRAVMRPWHS